MNRPVMIKVSMLYSWSIVGSEVVEAVQTYESGWLFRTGGERRGQRLIGRLTQRNSNGEREQLLENSF